MYSLGSMGGVRLGVLIQILEGYLVVGVVFFGGVAASCHGSRP